VATSLSVLTRNRDFRRLFGAELVVFGADWFVMVPLLVLLPELTGSGVWGALVLAADTGINALLLPYTGTIADRYDRRTIMMVSNLAALAAILLLFTVRSAATAPLALVAIGLVAVAKAFYSPAASAALPNVVDPEDLAAANAVAGSAWGTMTIVGASLGGIISSAFGPYVSFAVAAVSLVMAFTLTSLIRRPLQGPRDTTVPAQRAWPALIEALGYIGHRPRVRALVTVKSAVGLGNGVLTVFPLLAALYGVGPLGAGLLFAVRGAGALVGPMLMRPVLNHRSWLLPGLAISMSAYGLAYLGVAFTGWFPLVLLLVFVAHFAGGTNWVLSNYALQGEVPDRLRGRVFATDMMLATLAISVSQLVTASVVDLVDERVILAGCGLITLVYAIGWRIATRRLALTDPVPDPA
jgi:MFS family permease